MCSNEQEFRARRGDSIIYDPVGYKTLTLTFNSEGNHTGDSANINTTVDFTSAIDQWRIYRVELKRIHVVTVAGLTVNSVMGLRLRTERGLPPSEGYGNNTSYVKLLGSNWTTNGTTEFTDLFLANDLNGGIVFGSTPSIALIDPDGAAVTWETVTLQLTLQYKSDHQRQAIN